MARVRYILICFLKLGLIFVDSNSSELKSNQKFILPIQFFSKNIYSVGYATLCSKSVVMLTHNDITVTIHVLGQGVVGQVSSQLQRPAKVGGQEGVVH